MGTPISYPLILGNPQGAFEKYNVKVLGTQIEAIMKTEDRDLFSKVVEASGLLLGLYRVYIDYIGLYRGI